MMVGGGRMRAFWAGLCLASLTGCSGESNDAPFSRHDAGDAQFEADTPDTVDAAPPNDTGTDGRDASPDAEAAEDVSAEAAEDVSAEAAEDVGAEAAEDVGAEAAEDVSAEAAEDVGAEAAEDVSADSADDVMVDAMDEADSEPDAEPDAPPACAPNAFRCVGSQLERCNASQTAFEVVADCDPWACDETAEQCQACAPSSVSCLDDSTRRVCAADGLGFDDFVCPSATPYCVGQGTCVACRDETDCPQPGNDCEQATCEQGSCSTQPLPAGTTCGNEGVCTGNSVCGECVPGQLRCYALELELCDSLGVWAPSETCPFVCSLGACIGECVPGTQECVGSTPRACDADGNWVSEPTCAGAKPECFAGECVHATPPSCVGLATNCGPDQDDRCCAAASIPGGSFLRSFDGVTFKDATNAATVNEYGLDLYEVTVGRFRTFVDSGGGTKASPPLTDDGAHPLIAGSGWRAAWNTHLEGDSDALRAELVCSPALATWTDSPGGNETRPINCVTWFEAFAFCSWDGGRLATEAEWNYAAAGGDLQKVYPWSSPPNSSAVAASFASYWENGSVQCSGDGVPGCTLEDIVFVGSKAMGAGSWGHDSLAGNVWEWVLDAYANPYPIVPCNDCAWLGSDDENRVLRGGSFYGSVSTLYASARNPAGAAQRFFTAGIRCARALP